MKTHVGCMACHRVHVPFYDGPRRIASTSTPTQKSSRLQQTNFLRFLSNRSQKKKSTTENLFVDCFANKYLALYTRFRVGVDILCIHFNVSGREWVVKPHKQKSKSNNCCSFLTGARWSLRRFAFHDANLNDTTLFERWFDDCWHEWVERRNPSRDRMENRLVNLLSKQS